MNPDTIFDSPASRPLNDARWAVAREFIRTVRNERGLATALDVGAGVGYFTELLAKEGFAVIGVEGRETNVAVARGRFSHLQFELGDVEAESFPKLGTFDLVLCFGLLYHLENPFRAIRNLERVTGDILLISAATAPGSKASALLLGEKNEDDQSLTGFATYVTESSLVCMLRAAGFEYVYRMTKLPDHEEFRTSVFYRRRRTMLVSSRTPVSISGLTPMKSVRLPTYPWATPWGHVATFVRRAFLFVRKRLSK